MSNKPTSFEQACQNKGLDPVKALPDVSMVPEKFQKPIIAFAKLLIITDDIRGGWVPDWNNDDERKWFPWFDMEESDSNPSGFRFDDSAYDYSLTYSTGGSRLCLQSEEDSDHMAEHFLDLYRDMMIIPK